MLNVTKRKSVLSIILALAFIQFSIFALAPDGSGTNEPNKYSDWEVMGPNGGDVRAVAIDPRDKNRLYISTLDGQIHTSPDGGRTWNQLVNLNQPAVILHNLIVDAQDSQKIYVSGHRHKSPGGFFSSMDGGA